METSSTQQILLPLGFKKEHVFDTFLSEVDPSPGQVIRFSVFERKEPVCILVGEEESGKTHLCAALVNAAHQQGIDARYLSFKEFALNENYSTLTGYLEGLSEAELLVLDDVDQLKWNEELELALFNLYNHCIAESKQLVLSTRVAVSDLEIGLKDLVSRLQFALTVRLKPLSDAGKKDLFVRLAKARGIKMSRELADYISLRSARNIGALMDVLERLDHASLLEKRSLTVPFVKKVMGW
jgi:DnaA family protein